VLNGNGQGGLANETLALDEAAIRQVVQEYSVPAASGAERVVGVVPVALACGMAVLA